MAVASFTGGIAFSAPTVATDGAARSEPNAPPEPDRSVFIDASDAMAPRPTTRGAVAERTHADVMEIPLSKALEADRGRPVQELDPNGMPLGEPRVGSYAAQVAAGYSAEEAEKDRRKAEGKQQEILAVVLTVLIAVGAALYATQPALGLKRLAVFIGLVPGTILGVVLSSLNGGGSEALTMIGTSLAVGLALTCLLLITLAAFYWIISGFRSDRATPNAPGLPLEPPPPVTEV